MDLRRLNSLATRMFPPVSSRGVVPKYKSAARLRASCSWQIQGTETQSLRLFRQVPAINTGLHFHHLWLPVVLLSTSALSAIEGVSSFSAPVVGFHLFLRPSFFAFHSFCACLSLVCCTPVSLQEIEYAKCRSLLRARNASS